MYLLCNEFNHFTMATPTTKNMSTMHLANQDIGKYKLCTSACMADFFSHAASIPVSQLNRSMTRGMTCIENLNFSFYSLNFYLQIISLLWLNLFDFLVELIQFSCPEILNGNTTIVKWYKAIIFKVWFCVNEARAFPYFHVCGVRAYKNVFS